VDVLARHENGVRTRRENPCAFASLLIGSIGT